MERKVVMSFRDDTKSKFNVIVNHLKDSLTEAEIKAVMDFVLTNSLIKSKKGSLVSLESATVVDTTEVLYNF